MNENSFIRIYSDLAYNQANSEELFALYYDLSNRARNILQFQKWFSKSLIDRIDCALAIDAIAHAIHQDGESILKQIYPKADITVFARKLNELAGLEKQSEIRKFNRGYFTSLLSPDSFVFLEKQIGRTTKEDISDALEEYQRLFNAGIASKGEVLTLARCYPENEQYQEEVKKNQLDLEEKQPLVVGGPASVEMIDKENHLITTDALADAFKRFMSNFRARNVQVFHSDVQVGWPLAAYVTRSGQIFKSGVDDNGLWLISEIRDDIKIAKRVAEEIAKGNLRSYSIAGSATETKMMKKGIQDFMQVNKLDLAEVTICNKGVNQGAHFDILKEDRIPAVPLQRSLEASPEESIRKSLGYVEEGSWMLEATNPVEAFGEWLSKQHVAHHKHDAWQEHPVAVKHHQEYFQRQPTQVVEKPTTPAAVAKEPWQMTRAEYYEANGLPTAAYYEGVEHVPSQAANIARAHRISVTKAATQGKVIPPEVLADYPNLAAIAKIQPAASAPAAVGAKGEREKLKHMYEDWAHGTETKGAREIKNAIESYYLGKSTKEQGVLLAQKEFTEKTLKAIFGNSVRLYRGLEASPSSDLASRFEEGLKNNTIIRIRAPAVSSWSADPNISERWVLDYANNGYVITADVPVERIWNSYLTDANLYSRQQEFVVGGEGEIEVSPSDVKRLTRTPVVKSLSPEILERRELIAKPRPLVGKAFGPQFLTAHQLKEKLKQLQKGGDIMRPVEAFTGWIEKHCPEHREALHQQLLEEYGFPKGSDNPEDFQLPVIEEGKEPWAVNEAGQES